MNDRLTRDDELPPATPMGIMEEEIQPYGLIESIESKLSRAWDILLALADLLAFLQQGKLTALEVILVGDELLIEAIGNDTDDPSDSLVVDATKRDMEATRAAVVKFNKLQTREIPGGEE